MRLFKKGEFSLLLQIIMWTVVVAIAAYFLITYVIGGAATVPGEGLLTP